jgi:tetratricopeptide (TPR) repeat protein
VRAQDVIPKAKAAAERALAIDDALAEAHTSLASALEMEWDWPGAEREYKRAIELDPNYALAHKWYGLMLMGFGKLDDAQTHFLRARELDPFNLSTNVNVAQCLQAKRQYDRAVAEYKRVLELDPNFAATHYGLSGTYLWMGQHKESLWEWQEAARLAGDPEDLTMAKASAEAYEAGGLQASLRKQLDMQTALAKRRHVNYAEFARLYAQLGEKEKAFEWLNKSLEQREYALYQMVKGAPSLDGLRSDPRYKEILRKMKLPE